jgi:hypothetical protein
VIAPPARRKGMRSALALSIERSHHGMVYRSIELVDKTVGQASSLPV